MRHLFGLAATTLTIALATNVTNIAHAAASTPNPAPALSLTADRYSVEPGKTAVLTWNSTSASRSADARKAI